MHANAAEYGVKLSHYEHLQLLCAGGEHGRTGMGRHRGRTSQPVHHRWHHLPSHVEADGAVRQWQAVQQEGPAQVHMHSPVARIPDHIVRPAPLLSACLMPQLCDCRLLVSV